MKKPLIAAALCLVCGVCMLFTPLRFFGGLLSAAAVLFAAWQLLLRGRKSRFARAVRAFIAACLALGLAVFCVAEGFVLSKAKTDFSREPAAIVVLGAGVYGTAPSLSLTVRLQAALDYAADRPGIPIVVSGGQGPGEDITEAEAMYTWLTSRGLDPGRILLEDKSTSTEENLRFSLALLEENGISADDGIAVVSADYHLRRADMLFGGGIIPVAAHMPARFWPLTANYFIREAFGVVYLWIFG